jgi:hypothetical protein
LRIALILPLRGLLRCVWGTLRTVPGPASPAPWAATKIVDRCTPYSVHSDPLSLPASGGCPVCPVRATGPTPNKAAKLPRPLGDGAGRVESRAKGCCLTCYALRHVIHMAFMDMALPELVRAFALDMTPGLG